MVYANKAYHRLAGPLAEAGAAPSQSGIGLMSPAGDISPIAVSQEHKLTIDGRTEYYRARRRLIRGSDGSVRATALLYESTTKLKATATALVQATTRLDRSEEHTSELQSLMRISYAVFCLKKKTKNTTNRTTT